MLKYHKVAIVNFHETILRYNDMRIFCLLFLFVSLIRIVLTREKLNYILKENGIK